MSKSAKFEFRDEFKQYIIDDIDHVFNKNFDESTSIGDMHVIRDLGCHTGHGNTEERKEECLYKLNLSLKGITTGAKINIKKMLNINREISTEKLSQEIFSAFGCQDIFFKSIQEIIQTEFKKKDIVEFAKAIGCSKDAKDISSSISGCTLGGDNCVQNMVNMLIGLQTTDLKKIIQVFDEIQIDDDDWNKNKYDRKYTKMILTQLRDVVKKLLEEDDEESDEESDEDDDEKSLTLIESFSSRGGLNKADVISLAKTLGCGDIKSNCTKRDAAKSISDLCDDGTCAPKMVKLLRKFKKKNGKAFGKLQVQVGENTLVRISEAMFNMVE